METDLKLSELIAGLTPAGKMRQEIARELTMRRKVWRGYKNSVGGYSFPDKGKEMQYSILSDINELLERIETLYMIEKVEEEKRKNGYQGTLSF